MHIQCMKAHAKVITLLRIANTQRLAYSLKQALLFFALKNDPKKSQVLAFMTGYMRVKMT